MNIPDAWVAGIGASVAGAFYTVWKLVERYWDKRESEIDRLHDKQDRSEAKTEKLIERISAMEADHPARLEALRATGDRIIKETAEEVVARLNKESRDGGCGYRQNTSSTLVHCLILASGSCVTLWRQSCI